MKKDKSIDKFVHESSGGMTTYFFLAIAWS
jgi:ABC-type dipeptide/oligopeptide/nickel transport system ATPase component